MERTRTAPDPARRTRPTAPARPAAPVGRDTEAGLLRGLLEELREGRPALVEVHGPPGIGRSSLLDHAAALAPAAGVRVAAARATAEEAGLPYGVAAQLHARLLPALTPDSPAVPPAGAARPGDGQAGGAWTCRPADLCAVFLEAARSGPLLLLVDDVQWADPQSLRWLQALARRLAGAPLMLLTARNTAVPAGAHDRIEPCTLAGEDAVARHLLTLGPLPDRAVGEVLAGTWHTPVDEAFRTAALQHLEGSPALLRSVVGRFLRHGWTPDADHLGRLADSAAEAVRERTVRTVALLPEELLGVLRAVAVAGPDCTPGLIDALAGPRTLGTARVLALLSGAGLLAPGPRPGLRSPAAARAVLADLGSEHREELHARAAEWAHRAALPDRTLARLLPDARRIGAPWAVEALQREAADCRAAGRSARAARLLERALREPVSPALRARLLTDLSAAVLPTEPEVASRHLYRALHPTGDGSWPSPGAGADDGTGPARLRAAELLVARGDVVTPRSRIARAAADARPGTAEHSGLRALHWITEYSRPDPADETDAPLPEPGPPTPERSAEAAVAAWRTAQRGRDITRARSLARAALAPPAREHVPLTVRAAAAHALVLTGDTVEARRALDEILVRAGHRDAPAVAGLALLVTCLAELRAGRDEAAARALERCEELMPSRCWHPLMAPGPLALRALLHLRRGERSAAERVLATELPPGAEGGLSWAYLLYARGRVRLAGGQREAAFADLLECGRQLLARQASNPALLPWRSAAARTREPGDPVAVALVAEERRRALLWGSPTAMAAALGEGPGPARPGSPGPGRPASWQYRQALVALGTAPYSGHLTVDSLLGSDRGAGARRPAPGGPLAPNPSTSGPASASVPGPAHVPASVPASAPAAPRVPEPRTPSARPPAAGPLTRAERRVAALAASGRANRAIAEELAVTPRTVELHLTKAYRKLGIRGRPQLPAALERTPRESA
ncbi:AAA family ATPase [Streptomyces sp. NBC_00513]|uniref:helix-turn-helix transcriptional regulator n=1 Tax=unclassified Streptomyces TaxID=2593676 RepID=UPI002253ACE3|nr:LuxR family transcriptional regulator [Streptomyces sp. NBC_00424]MCX5071077.1 AAA family ATPase [Streptomyces sp. NBC_00424]WUD45498.1 AAA family ATPase [Streptomyces sp. NBC_00513]